MFHFFKLFVIFSLCCFSLNTFAQANNDDVKNTCEVSGGQWTESASGWACCWADWGCYGCVNGVCKIKCYNERCRKANESVRPGPDVKRVKGLAPVGGVAPIVPKLNKGSKRPPAVKNTQ